MNIESVKRLIFSLFWLKLLCDVKYVRDRSRGRMWRNDEKDSPSERMNEAKRGMLNGVCCLFIFRIEMKALLFIYHEKLKKWKNMKEILLFVIPRDFLLFSGWQNWALKEMWC